MIYVLKTGSTDHDHYFLITQILPKVKKKSTQIRKFYCDNPDEFSRFLLGTDSLSLFSTETNIFFLYNLKVSVVEKKALESKRDEIIILINPSTKSLGLKEIVFDKKISQYDIHRIITEQLQKNNLPTDSSTVSSILNRCQFIDDAGNITFSPLQIPFIIKQLKVMGGMKLEKSLINIQDLWKIVSSLFLAKKERDIYFTKILETFDIFEVLSNLRSQIGLLVAVQIGREQNIDQTSLAKQLKKNPFYIQNLIQILTSSKKSSVQLTRIFGRILTLEMKIKNGEIDEPEMAFSVLLSTL